MNQRHMMAMREVMSTWYYVSLTCKSYIMSWRLNRPALDTVHNVIQNVRMVFWTRFASSAVRRIGHLLAVHVREWIVYYWLGIWLASQFCLSLLLTPLLIMQHGRKNVTKWRNCSWAERYRLPVNCFVCLNERWVSVSKNRYDDWQINGQNVPLY